MVKLFGEQEFAKGKAILVAHKADLLEEHGDLKVDLLL